jgi:hypothetical protein
MNEKELTKKEVEFCRWYAQLQNPKEAALKSGYSVMPEYRALTLLAKKNIKKKIQELEKENSATESLVCAGFQRLAFGSIGDAIQLILSVDKDVSPNVEKLDLFNVSEIKYTSGKGMEIKFFDRLKALERLSEFTEAAKPKEAISFYEALERSARERDCE